MSIRSKLAWTIGVIGFIGMVFGIMLISSYNHTSDDANQLIGSLLLGFGIVGIASGILTSDGPYTRIQSNNPDGDEQV